jgi:molybdopterin-dependent oxidoreductase alpha subunit
MLEKYSGVSRDEMLRFAKMLGEAKSAVFVWSMGITQHENGVDNVRAILNLALARGFIGREKCGVMPIRGHSGVQGGGEMGCTPWNLPGGDPINESTTQRFSQMWGFEVPSWKGLAAVDMIEAAHSGLLDVFYIAGGNFLDTLPDPNYIREALSHPDLRVHQDIVLTSQMLVEPADTVVLLPAATRYEQRDGGVDTSTERQVIFSPNIRPPLAESRSEWEIFMELAERVNPTHKDKIHFANGQRIRDEIARANPSYDGIQHLKEQGDHFQWGGDRLCEGGAFRTESGRATFASLHPPEHVLPEGEFILKTRRGKQFNSMVQYQRDPLNGAMRDDVLMSRDDADALHLNEGDAVLLTSHSGELRAKVKLAKIKPRNVQVHWPEGNVLLPHSVCDVESGVPAYKAVVRITKSDE